MLNLEKIYIKNKQFYKRIKTFYDKNIIQNTKIKMYFNYNNII